MGLAHGLMLISALLYALMTVFVRMLRRFPDAELITMRSVFAIVFVLLTAHTLKIPWRGKNKKVLLLRGLAGTGSLLCYFETIKHMNLGTAAALQNTFLLFTVFISSIAFGDRICLRQWLSLFIAFSGVVVLRGFSGAVPNFDLFIGLLGAFLSGVAYSSVRALKETDHSLTIVLYYPLIALVVVGPMTALNFVAPQGSEYFLILALGLVTTLAQWAMTKAYQLEHASKISTLGYLSPLFAWTFGVLFFGEAANLTSLVGCALIMLGVSMSVGKKSGK